MKVNWQVDMGTGGNTIQDILHLRLKSLTIGSVIANCWLNMTEQRASYLASDTRWWETSCLCSSSGLSWYLQWPQVLTRSMCVNNPEDNVEMKILLPYLIASEWCGKLQSFNNFKGKKHNCYFEILIMLQANSCPHLTPAHSWLKIF